MDEVDVLVGQFSTVSQRDLTGFALGGPVNEPPMNAMAYIKGVRLSRVILLLGVAIARIEAPGNSVLPSYSFQG